MHIYILLIIMFYKFYIFLDILYILYIYRISTHSIYFKSYFKYIFCLLVNLHTRILHRKNSECIIFLKELNKLLQD